MWRSEEVLVSEVAVALWSLYSANFDESPRRQVRQNLDSSSFAAYSSLPISSGNLVGTSFVFVVDHELNVAHRKNQATWGMTADVLCVSGRKGSYDTLVMGRGVSDVLEYLRT